ncbi:MAG: potassium/proton antiporter, partial [Muribaculaceae bacterium]|nr:potassium/proton antiporter [Muribaculaceae bacterium]
QGTTVIAAARKLRLIDNSAQQEEDFGVELDEELPTSLHTMVLRESDLTKGNTLSDIALPQGQLVMMIRRGDRYIVPNGKRKLSAGDTLLIIKEDASRDCDV